MSQREITLDGHSPAYETCTTPAATAVQVTDIRFWCVVCFKKGKFAVRVFITARPLARRIFLSTLRYRSIRVEYRLLLIPEP